ncbi:MAG: Gfo/Idh/MocA family oxidoreductase, partial [Chthoniobacterales bacterium]
MIARRTLQVGLIGHGFMGRAHANAWRQAPRFFPLPADVRLHTICGRDQRATANAAAALGFAESATDWRAVVDDPAIDVINICTPNDSHAQI